MTEQDGRGPFAGYECRYCPFVATERNPDEFVEHLFEKHPEKPSQTRAVADSVGPAAVWMHLDRVKKDWDQSTLSFLSEQS